MIVSAPLYVIGDTHGQIAFLEQALQWIAADGGDAARIVFLGDFEDRGPDSRGVIERVMTGMAAGRARQMRRSKRGDMCETKALRNWVDGRQDHALCIARKGVRGSQEA